MSSRPKVIWSADGESDLRKMFEQFEDRAEGSGEPFLLALDASLELLRSFPEMAPMYSKPFRRLLVGRGKAGVFYVVENRGIIVHAVQDLRQDPRQIRRRLGLQS